MPLPIINFDPLLTSPAVRGITWSLKKTEQWKTIRQEANRRVVKVPQYNNPLYQWELKWNYINDNANWSIQPTQSSNAPFSDFQVLRSLYFTAKGQGNEFLYQPQNNVITNQLIGQPDANGNSEVVLTVGGYNANFSSTTLSITNVALTTNVLTITVSSLDALTAGMTVKFGTLGTATFLNGQTVTVTSVNAGALSFTAFFSHANYVSAADTGTLTVQTTMVPVYESVQSLLGASLTSLSVNGTAVGVSTDYVLAGPSTVSPYDGYVIQWNYGGTPGAKPPAGSQILAAYTYFYQSEFVDDSLEYENFIPFMWKVGSLKFQQVGL